MPAKCQNITELPVFPLICHPSVAISLPISASDKYVEILCRFSLLLPYNISKMVQGIKTTNIFITQSNLNTFSDLIGVSFFLSKYYPIRKKGSSRVAWIVYNSSFLKEFYVEPFPERKTHCCSCKGKSKYFLGG